MEPFFYIAQSRLFQRLPMLALPLGLLEPRQGNVGKMGTDGVSLLVEEPFLEASVRAGDGEAEETLLHCVLHCIMGHPWQRHGREEGLWSLACDMAAVFLTYRLTDKPMTDPVLLRVWHQCPGERKYHAPTLYQMLSSGELESGQKIQNAFRIDDHSPWNRAETRRNCGIPAGEGMDALWQRQMEKLRPYLKETPPIIGHGTSGEKLGLPEIEEFPTRFSDLLRQFATVQENRRVNDADFSYGWYTYGLEHYDGMPLIEPLEYSEERRMGEMVIVLDTSGSCSRGLIAYFLGAVRQILCRERLFFERFHLHILQCDCKVHADAVLTNLEEFGYYIDHLELYGGGGTDFCPAFSHIDDLIASGDLTHLSGVLYFSDGLGVFPREAPDYPVAFVMMKDRYDDIDVPDWAIQLVLDYDFQGGQGQWI